MFEITGSPQATPVVDRGLDSVFAAFPSNHLRAQLEVFSDWSQTDGKQVQVYLCRRQTLPPYHQGQAPSLRAVESLSQCLLRRPSPFRYKYDIQGTQSIKMSYHLQEIVFSWLRLLGDPLTWLSHSFFFFLRYVDQNYSKKTSNALQLLVLLRPNRY